MISFSDSNDSIPSMNIIYRLVKMVDLKLSWRLNDLT